MTACLGGSKCVKYVNYSLMVNTNLFMEKKKLSPTFQLEIKPEE